MSCGKENKKKRTKNTSNLQYELYLQCMELDYCFRSGTINPSLDENYISNKWKDLTNKLNACGDGPALTVDEWQRRFRDWKYSTKAKYRKLHSHRLQTGSGPPSDIKMSDIEERGLSVWGRSTVTGTPSVTQYEGVELSTENSILNTASEIRENNVNNCQIVEMDCNPVIFEVDDSVTASSLNELCGNNEKLETESNPKPQKIFKKTQSTPKRNAIRPTPLSEVAASLSNNLKENNFITTDFNKIVQTFCDNYTDIENEKLILKKENLQLKQKKLNFDIQKYTYENKDFIFNNNN